MDYNPMSGVDKVVSERLNDDQQLIDRSIKMLAVFLLPQIFVWIRRLMGR